MINTRNISGLLIFIALVVYIVLGDPDNSLWSSFYYVTWNALVLYLGNIVLRSQRDLITKIIIKLFMGVALVGVIFNLYRVIDIEGYNSINRGWEVGIIMACAALIFLIYSKKWTF
jgi:hypothetical protein